jgi:anti-sigma B factor antagonist
MVLDLKIELRQEKNVPIISINGEIDIYTYPKLTEALNSIIEKGGTQIVINLENVRYIDSTGLGALADGANRVYDQGGHVSIICNKPQVKKIFDVSGLAKRNLTLYPNEAEAVENARKQLKS